MAGLGTLLVYGVYLGAWADRHGLYQGNLLSTWYLPAFLGYLGSIVALLLLGARHAARQAGSRRLAPPGYEVAFAGVVLVAVALLFDIAWQAILGDENADERTLAPTRLLLALGIAMVAAGPLVAAWRRIDAAGDVAVADHERRADHDRNLGPHLRSRLPQVISLGLTVATLAFLTSVADPSTQHWAELDPGGDRLARPDDIWTMATDGSRQTRLTTARAGVETFQEPTWTPDGAAIMVTLGRALADANEGTKGIAFDVGAIGIDGKPMTAITDTPDFDAQAHLSPDGRQVVYSSERQTTASLPTPARGGCDRRGIDLHDLGAAAGPQPGRDPGLGVQSGGTSATPGFRWDVYVANADGTGERRLTEGGTINIATGWGADGRILFHSDRDGDYDIYSMRADGSDLRQLTDDPADETWPALAADGRIAFTSNRQGGYEIWAAGADGSQPIRLTDDPADDWMPAWSPDGATIAFLSNRDDMVEIYAVPSAGGVARDLSRTPGMDELITAGAWSPDGSTIVYSSSPAGTAATDPRTRSFLAMAAIMVWSVVLSGLMLASIRRGSLPPAAITIALLIAAIPAGIASDEPRVVAAAAVAGIVGDLLVWFTRPGPTRPRAAWLFGLVLPATWTATYLAAVVATTGTSLSTHVLAGAIVMSGIIGLLMALLVMRERGPQPSPRRRRDELTDVLAWHARPGAMRDTIESCHRRGRLRVRRRPRPVAPRERRVPGPTAIPRPGRPMSPRRSSSSSGAVRSPRAATAVMWSRSGATARSNARPAIPTSWSACAAPSSPSRCSPSSSPGPPTTST